VPNSGGWDFELDLVLALKRAWQMARDLATKMGSLKVSVS